MAKVITINIQKGGVGKSTTTHEISVNLAMRGKRVLMLDLDPQGNLSRMCGADHEAVTIYDVLKGDCSLGDAIQSVGLVDMVLSDKLLKRADKEFSDWKDVRRLKKALEPVKDGYDYVVIDTPPSLGIMPSMALCAADYVLIPLEASSNGLQGLGQLKESIDEIRDPDGGCNPNLEILGLLLTMYNERTSFSAAIRDEIDNIAANLGTKVYDTYIHRAVAVLEAQGFQQSVSEYMPQSKPAIDYEKITVKIVEDIKNGEK